MEDIHIKGSKDIYIIPTVDFSVSSGKCIISGESFLEETAKFYTPLIEWIKNYKTIADSIEFVIKLSYFNTSTSKWILNLLNELKRFEKLGGKVTIFWYYHQEDVDMRDDIIDYMSDSNLDIKMFPFD
ncbi:MAG: DUF1987 domain-containing protein [Bacteroidales bacterium]|nr:DUF1987 domain-containing protein [Bacteroidales bacterium]